MPWKKITEMSREDLFSIDPQINRLLSLKEILYIFRLMDGLWQWTKKSEIPEHHPVTKAGFCAESFCNAHKVLEKDALCQLFAWQLIYKMAKMQLDPPVYLAGIPTGATKLVDALLQLWSCRKVELTRISGDYISMDSEIESESTVLLIDDMVTEGTAAKQGARSIGVYGFQSDRHFYIYHLILSILQRGDPWLFISGPGLGLFKVESLAYFPIRTWPQRECPLCRAGSKPVKAKNPASNWDLLMNSLKNH